MMPHNAHLKFNSKSEMKYSRLSILPLVMVAASVVVSSCNDDDKSTWEQYKEWREANEAYYDTQKYMMEDGENVYTTLTPSWNSGASILIRYLSDRSKTEGNLSPMLNSTVKVKYIGRLYNDVAFDSSYLRPDSVSLFNVSEVVPGWTTALQYMRVGDSARIVLPYMQAYGVSGSSSGSIPPYSTLVFNLKLVDIVDYERP